MNRKVIFWSVIMALGGFLFGFDTAVISGAEKAIQAYWQLSSTLQGLTVSIAIVGTVFGALFGRLPADSLGRKKTLIIIAFIFLFSSLGSALVTNWYLFMVLRFIGGLGIGASSVTAPIFISEISPPKSRGRLVILFQLNIVLGILIAFVSNYLIGIFGQNLHDSWRYMLGVMAVPSLLFLLLLNFVPESPRWLILHRTNHDDAKKILKEVNPEGYEQDYITIIKANAEDAKDEGGEHIFTKRHRFPVMLAILFAFFNQVSGINAIMYYAPRIFEMAGFDKTDSLRSTTYLGVANFIFTMLAIAFIDKIGRRKLMLIGSFGLILTLGMVAYSFYTKNFSAYYITGSLFGFIAFFAFSQGAVIWVFISEIFPNQVRAKGQTMGSFTHWIMAAAITFSFPWFAENLGGGSIFSFFTAMMVLQLLFVWKMMPETKGKSLEQIERTLTMH